MTRPYDAIVLNMGFDDPPLRLDHDLRWHHLAVLAAGSLAFGTVIYALAFG